MKSKLSWLFDGRTYCCWFSEKFTSKVKSVSFIAPAGYMSLHVSWYQKLLPNTTLPLISQFIGVVCLYFYGGNSTLVLSTEEDENHVPQNRLNEIYSEQMSYEGFTRSLYQQLKTLIYLEIKVVLKE